MKQADEKILERVRKLLAMSKDTSSPNEAAIAANRARKLIDEYQISEFDLHAEKAFDFVEREYKTNRNYHTNLGIMSVAIANLNDCQAILKKDNGNAYYVFQGMLVDAVTCVEMMMYLRAELYFQELEIKGRANKEAYRRGFVSGIAAQVKEILKDREKQTIKSTGQSLVVVKTELVRNHFGAVKYSRSKSKYGNSNNAYSQGYDSGKNTNLSRQISDNFAAKIS